ncbi:hypothetical protein J1792_31790 [Streptomyces triculaminicus]|uniref:Uncharacterized protein n=2 Tax=Streptomyces TaxID=1883 RepID=A0A939FUP6_9ACTN|nr:MULTISPECIES: hypothetical protein [Streptomyces]MBO0657139.1 hypothetical protein [Streptomyces triculaminicus]QSY52782.1 hypothetical protein J3S04_31995 [Streptomyces griseocarneus]
MPKQVTPAESAACDLQDHAALWNMGEVRASDVVDAACDALVTGLDSPGLEAIDTDPLPEMGIMAAHPLQAAACFGVLDELESIDFDAFHARGAWLWALL